MLEPLNVVGWILLQLNVVKNDLLDMLPGRQTHILYPDQYSSLRRQ